MTGQTGIDDLGILVVRSLGRFSTAGSPTVTLLHLMLELPGSGGQCVVSGGQLLCVWDSYRAGSS